MAEEKYVTHKEMEQIKTQLEKNLLKAVSEQEKDLITAAKGASVTTGGEKNNLYVTRKEMEEAIKNGEVMLKDPTIQGVINKNDIINIQMGQKEQDRRLAILEKRVNWIFTSIIATLFVGLLNLAILILIPI